MNKSSKPRFMSRKQLAEQYSIDARTMRLMLESEADYKGSVVDWHYKQNKRLFSPAAVRWIEAKFEGFADKSEVISRETCKLCGKNVA